ncbi:unnamed protein product [Vitrella brassicaformis CCMP3155]|uniref:Uncharacterized protein n=2 Tax=Vitrella brassicaformis TaxID=1169539 RepID=A0A0G4GPN8_VITBC|nr:unnamed protein product [Vitrella brassicaformis CCMP3155]|eukprot:CEM32319.1 unnamed protein product [Vitrella brassicaformis CCMP3155]
MTPLVLVALLLGIGYAGGRHLGTRPAISGFQALQMPKITHASLEEGQLVRRMAEQARATATQATPPTRPAIPTIPASRKTDRAMGLFEGCAVYYDANDCYQLEVGNKRRPIPAANWPDIKRFADVNIVAGVPQISVAAEITSPASKEAVGLFDGQSVHLDHKGGYLVELGDEWRPIREEHWPDVKMFTDVDIAKIRQEILGGSGGEGPDLTFVRAPSSGMLFQLVTPGTGASPSRGDAVKFNAREWRRGFAGEPGTELDNEWKDERLESDQPLVFSTNEKGERRAISSDFFHEILWSMRVGETRRVIRLPKFGYTAYYELELLKIE